MHSFSVFNFILLEIGATESNKHICYISNATTGKSNVQIIYACFSFSFRTHGCRCPPWETFLWAPMVQGKLNLLSPKPILILFIIFCLRPVY